MFELDNRLAMLHRCLFRSSDEIHTDMLISLNLKKQSNDMDMVEDENTQV